MQIPFVRYALDDFDVVQMMQKAIANKVSIVSVVGVKEKFLVFMIAEDGEDIHKLDGHPGILVGAPPENE